MIANRSATNLHYNRQGDGPDVLLVHGWASSGQMWSRLMHDLGHVARFWAVDLYGFGLSPRPAEHESIYVQQHAEMLLDFCEQHHIRPKAIVGHSMGGMLALKLAAEQPDLTDKLILMSPVVTGRMGHPIEFGRLFTNEIGSYTLSKSKPLWTLAQNVFSPIFSRPAHWYLDDVAASRIQQDFQRASWQASTHALHSLARENMHPHLASIQHPTLVILGSNDTTVPPNEGRHAANHLPNAQLLELAHTHHQPLDEQPERVVKAVQDFLQ
ncbi:MAG: alpha/beta hydrolase [Anaerolineae bacterium]|nr:alpha/beta hydrolase [Anaerolineae bacterium]